MNITEKFKRAAILIVDVAALPPRALWYDAKTAFKKSNLRPLFYDLTLPTVPALIVKDMIPLFALSLAISITYIVAWDTPVIADERENFEQLPLYKNYMEKVQNRALPTVTPV